MAYEEVHRGIGGPVGRKAHAVALVHGAGPGVGVHMAIPGGIHLQRHHMCHSQIQMHSPDSQDTSTSKREITQGCFHL